MSVRTRRCPQLRMGSGGAGETAPAERPEVPVEIAEGGIEQLAAWDDYQIQRDIPRLVHQPEHLSNQSFSPVSVDRVPEFSRGHDPEPKPRCRAGRHQQGEVAGRHARSGVEHPRELAPTPHPLRLAERVRRQVISLGRRNGQALAPLGTTALQHQAAVLGGHSRQKPVSFRTMATVWLESTFHDVETPEPVVWAAEKRKYYRPPSRTVNARRCGTVPFPACSVGSPPEVFHSCGKKCGKA